MGKYIRLVDYTLKRSKILDTTYNKMPHYVYSLEDLEQVKVEHRQPQSFRDRVALRCIKTIRKSYDYFTGYNPQKMTIRKWIQRGLILETVAGVPGMVAGMAIHLKSLRSLQKDRGWINHLLEEADNQRFHLFVFLHLKSPSIIERIFILLMQGIFFNMFFATYLVSPKFCHRFVGYLQQEAVKTYTAMLADIQSPSGVLNSWNHIPAPRQTLDYYQLKDGSTYKDLIKCIRADEACHRGTNHFLADIDYQRQIQIDNIQVISSGQEPQFMSIKTQAPKQKSENQIK